MKVVIFEDNDEKFNVISGVLNGKGVKQNLLFRVKSISEFAKLEGSSFDLGIIDIRMPAAGEAETINAGVEILKMLDFSGRSRMPVLAITAFRDEAVKFEDQFAARGCIIYDYDNQKLWSEALDIYIAQVRDRGRYEFVIFTAIQKERNAFLSAGISQFERIERYGIDHCECEIDGVPGSVVLLPKMGLVNAAIVVARTLEQYAPKITAMSGICAGIKGNCELGQLLVTELCWEYQSGKWYDDIFQAEPYQVSIDERTKTILSQLIESTDFLHKLEEGYRGKIRPSKVTDPKLAIFATGSAVIASQERLDHIIQQHRKVNGIDMELFGFHRAVELCNQSMKSFSSKVVVDNGDKDKGDDLQDYGSFLSAKFTVSALKRLMAS